MIKMQLPERPEALTIRPPSEWRSLLLRSTRGCNWNNCRFCGIYPAMGEKDFSVRPIKDVVLDIEWYKQNMPQLTTAFIGDADPLCRNIEESVTIITTLREMLPRITRVTVYARAATLSAIGESGIALLAKAGLNRVHIGLESGDPQTLQYHKKGQSPELVEQVVACLKKCGIEVSYYVLLGLGGRDRWREHIDGTAAVITATNPDFIRLRRMWVYGPGSAVTATACPLVDDIASGTFIMQTPEGTVHELRRLIEKIGPVSSRLVSDHSNNYLDVSGCFPHDRSRMLCEVDAFLQLPQEKRDLHYAAVGSRL